jgi:hypothetical protein
MVGSFDSFTPVYGRFRVSGIRPGIDAGLTEPRTTILLSRPFTGVLFIGWAGDPQTGLTTNSRS